jgi:hypothetical protein
MTRTTHLRRMSRPRAVVVGKACSAALLPGSGPSTADTVALHQPHAGGWTRFHAEQFTHAAGELCPFALSSKVLFDREYVRTTCELPNGDPRREEYVGPLVVRVISVDSGRSVQRGLSARGVVTNDRDGSYTVALLSPARVGFYPGDILLLGCSVLRGRHTVRFEPDGSWRLVADHGREANLCATLS